MPITITTTIEYDEQEWREALFGSGCFSYPWYEQVISNATGPDEERSWEITMTDPDTGAHEGIKVVTLKSLALAASVVASENAFLAKQIADKDIDSDGADLVFQQAVLGTVTFG